MVDPVVAAVAVAVVAVVEVVVAVAAEVVAAVAAGVAVAAEVAVDVVGVAEAVGAPWAGLGEEPVVVVVHKLGRLLELSGRMY